MSVDLYIGAHAPNFSGNFTWIQSGLSVDGAMWRDGSVNPGSGDTAAMDFTGGSGLLFQHDSGDPGAEGILCECM